MEQEQRSRRRRRRRSRKFKGVVRKRLITVMAWLVALVVSLAVMLLVIDLIHRV